MLKAWLELCRISNLPTAWTNVLAGWLLAGGSLRDQRLLWLLLGGSLMYSAGMILNDACDAKWDREHRKERPIPSGRVSASSAGVIGIMALLSGWLVSWMIGGASGKLGLVLVAAILAYDLHHKQWLGSVVIMGMCRTLLYLLAASPSEIKGMAEVFPLHGWLLPFALGIGCYIVGLTMIARNESRECPSWIAGAAAWLLLIFPGIIASAWMIQIGDWRMLGLLAVFALLVSFSLRVMKKGGPAIGQAVGILLAGIAVVDALAVATVSFPLACALAAAAPLLRLWQRWIAAT